MNSLHNAVTGYKRSYYIPLLIPQLITRPSAILPSLYSTPFPPSQKKVRKNLLTYAMSF